MAAYYGVVPNPSDKLGNEALSLFQSISRLISSPQKNYSKKRLLKVLEKSRVRFFRRVL